MAKKKTQTIECFYFAVPYEGDYMEIRREDDSPMRANSREELIEADLEEAKEKAAAVPTKLFIVKQTLEAEEL